MGTVVTSSDSSKREVREIFDELSQDARLVLQAVIDVERANLHMGNPHSMPTKIKNEIDRLIR